VVLIGITTREAEHWSAVIGGFGRTGRDLGFAVRRDSFGSILPERVEGLCLGGILTWSISEARLARRHFPRLPIVAVAMEATDELGEPFDVIALVEERMGATAAKYLWDCGLKNLATWDIGMYPFARRRLAGFTAELARLGPAPGKRDFHFIDGAAGVWTRITTAGKIRHWLRTLARPTGIFAACDDYADLLLHECALEGLRVPEDVAVIGVNDDHDTCTVATPQLSSVAINWTRIGELAASLMHEQLAGHREQFKRLVMGPAGVTARQSTNLLAIGDDDVARALRIIRGEARRLQRVDDVLRQLPVNRKVLERKFRVLLGRSIMQQIRHVKLQSAMFMLANTEHPIEQIAQDCGLGHRRNFAPAFRKFTGVTARAYRNRARFGASLPATDDLTKDRRGEDLRALGTHLIGAFDRNGFMGKKLYALRAARAVELLESRRLLSAASFLSPVNTAFPAAAVSTAKGDLNGDGIPDLVATYANNTAQVFLGSSNGSFAGGQVLNTGGTVEALGEFTTSGHLDLATADGVFESNGNGTFSSTPIAGFTLPTDTVALYAVNVTGGANTDLVAGIFTPGSGDTATISIAVMLGNGNGTFGSPIITTIGTTTAITAQYARAFVFGDFTGSSGHMDVVTPFGILLGTGTGSFGAPTALPGSSASLPTGPLIAEGDFNGDGNLDLAVEPPGSSAGVGDGNVELLLGTGTGTFTVGQTIDLSADGGVSSLTAADVNGDGQLDLIAGVGENTPNGGQLAVMLNNGAGVLQAPTLFASNGIPINVYTGDFNGDGKTDILATDDTLGADIGSNPVANSAAVYLNNSTTPLAATVSLTSSANPTIIGIPVQFTATVGTASTNSISTASPTGTVTFYDNGNALGIGTLSTSGVATLTTSALTAGQHAIVADYSGDTNFNAADSASLTEKVLATSAKTPLVVPAIASLTVPAVAISGDKATVDLTINNEGGAAANGKVAATFYLSSDGVIDTAAVPITTKKFSVHLGIGGAATSAVKFSVPALPAGTYAVLVVLAPVSGLTSDQVATTVAASSTTFQSLGYAFGTVGIHKNVKTTTADANGDTATLSLTGPGTGVVTTTNGQTTITVTGTTGASAITIVSRTGSFTFNTLTVAGALKSLNAKSVVDAGTLTIGSGANVSIAIGTGDGGVLDSAAPITTLTVGNWTAGQIIAPSIGTLSVSGDISADVFTHGGGIGSTKIGGIAGGAWAIAQNIGTLDVKGSVSSAEILAGDDAGADNTLGTSDDIYSAATIGSVIIDGSDTSTTIGAGAVPSNGSFQFLPNSAVRSILVKGAISTDARFAAFTFPATATLAGAKVDTATDPHFES
jgi:LacI family transcriptional regulator